MGDGIFHSYDAIVIGAGGAGLRAAMAARRNFAGKIAVVSKVFPTASGTSAARGGIGAALGREEKDSVDWHIRDTVRGGDFLVDFPAAKTICEEAEENLVELEQLGVPFNRNPAGTIGQRQFAGHYGKSGLDPVKRACFCGDYSGQVIVQTLFDHCRQMEIDFFNEFQVLELIIEDAVVCGFVALDLASGNPHLFNSPSLLLAGGGAGQLYSFNSNARATSGDLQGLVYEKGIPLEDMEFVQFHPTALPETGILVTEAARGIGGYLLNSEGKRFMEKYAPEKMELAPRDIVTRAILSEIKAGRGVRGNSVYLDMTHLNREQIETQLPELVKTARLQMDIDLSRQPLKVRPVAHYFMGGIPIDINGQVLADGKKEIVSGLFAAGECGCLSLHGANRLGTNSLLEIIVMGKRAGKHLATHSEKTAHRQIDRSFLKKWQKKIEHILTPGSGPQVGKIRKKLQILMSSAAGVYRNGKNLKSALDELKEIEEQGQKSKASGNRRFNYSLSEKFELDNMISTARAVLKSALGREESRGAHYRVDFPERSDDNWLKHSLVREDNGETKLEYKDVETEDES